MLFRIYCLYDAKVESFNMPFYMRTEAEALRGFTEVCNDLTNNICKFAEDFTLFEMGIYNQIDGTFQIHATIIPVAKAINLRKSYAGIPPDIDHLLKAPLAS